MYALSLPHHEVLIHAPATRANGWTHPIPLHHHPKATRRLTCTGMPTAERPAKRTHGSQAHPATLKTRGWYRAHFVPPGWLPCAPAWITPSGPPSPPHITPDSGASQLAPLKSPGASGTLKVPSNGGPRRSWAVEMFTGSHPTQTTRALVGIKSDPELRLGFEPKTCR